MTEMIKPAPLIGGTPAYQKNNGTNYWYCRIKDGRDEFMCLQFSDITERDLMYDANGQKRDFSTKRQQNFKINTLKAIKNKPAEGFRWIPVYEPSINEDGEIQFVPDKGVFPGLNSYQWENRLRKYSPANESQMASTTTYFLLLMRWLKDGVATLVQIADHSKEISPFTGTIIVERTGERQFGGLYDFVGNTTKQVKATGNTTGFFELGCSYKNDVVCPLAALRPTYAPYFVFDDSVGFLELKK